MVTVAVESGVVTLGGTVFSLAEREALHVIAENAAGARGVEDHMVVLDPVSGYAYGVV
jgi:osmotically-inducible protein OsmY